MRLVIALVLALATGCLKHPQFECAESSECEGVGPGATCEADGFCSFTDDACTLGRRYGDNAGDNSGRCVGDDGSGPRECFGSGVYEVCIDGGPTGVVTIDGTLNTDTDPRCLADQPASWVGQPAACFVAGGMVSVADVDVTGARPLVVIGAVVDITGTLNAASHIGGSTGPAADATCTAFGSDATDSAPNGGGGAGASFMTKGGDGGRGDNSATKPGGTAPAADAAGPATLRGGCLGQDGGNGNAAGGTAGHGGGAVYVAATTLTIGGRINVSGAGGSAGGDGSGGGGGGSGGMIVMIADTFTLSGNLVANGGSGAAGGDFNSGGANGRDPSSGMPTTAASGAFGPGGRGGDGFALGHEATNGASGNNRAGGGGGGGGGYIQANQALTGGQVSPAVVVVP